VKCPNPPASDPPARSGANVFPGRTDNRFERLAVTALAATVGQDHPWGFPMTPGSPIKADHILIVEDDDSLRRVLRIQLEAAGYEITEAENGLRALEILESETPDLVLLDVMMPEMDGYTACKKIREQRRLAQLPIIFLTAKDAPESRIMSLGEGANDYMTKPYDRKELLLRVRNLIGWGRAQRDSNPLTGLPGNSAIEMETEARLAKKAPFALLYLDLDYFKAYNDYYSYRAGDRVIKLIADTAAEAIERLGNPDDFLGHIGGDDFVAITTPDKADAVCGEIVAKFDQRILTYYEDKDRERGYVEVENRRYQMERFPLVSVTIVLIESDRYQIDHIAMLNDLVVELKKRGKRTPGSVVVRDQRQGAQEVPRTGSDG
jgi:diguanylate cyclase (GGDEF)-like protein